MKTLILGFLSLTLLGACATFEKNMVSEKAPPAANGFCHANNGIFGVLVDKEGIAHPFACETLRGNMPIRQPGKIEDGLVFKKNIEFGKAKKFAPDDPNNPDPCIHYVLAGKSYYFCW